MVGNVFITGVSSGIGWGLAREYLAQGVEVYGISRREPKDFAGQTRFNFCSIDLGDSNLATHKIPELLRTAQRLDLVVLNAGVLGRVADMSDITADEFRHVLEINLIANKVVLDTLFSLKIPIQQVVAISSGAATTANRGWNAYAISKAALNMMIALYATERPETHFCALAPGIVDTQMQDQIFDMPREQRFASLDMLRTAKGSPMMPKPEAAAARLIDGIAKAPKYPSGSFLDIHSLVKRSW
ncbi:MAG TPA: SDR family NAD(P)-dependent oxidoreductase [Verrucomicrobiae bacterium]